MFVDVVGQERAVETLRRASERPSHAYLLVGPRGSGVEDAARDFAALLIGVGDDERGLRLVQRGVHPDVVEFAPGGASYRVQGRRTRHDPSRGGARADRSRPPGADPVRGRAAARQPERVGERDAEDDRGAAAAHDRGARHRGRRRSPADDPVAVPAHRLRSGRRRRAARRARARRRRRPRSRRPRPRSRAASSPAPVRSPDRSRRCAPRSRTHRPGVDGTGATAFARRRGARCRGRPGRRRGDRAATTRSCASSTPSSSGSGTPTATRGCCGGRIEERQQREARRTRIDLLLEGVTAIETVYRDALADPAPPLNQDRPRLVVPPRAAAAALDACREAREAFLINEKGLVRLTHLLLSLPPASRLRAGLGSATASVCCPLRRRSSSDGRAAHS